MPSFEAIQEEVSLMLDTPMNSMMPEDYAVMDEYLNELAKQEADKVDAFGQFLRLETARAEALKNEADRLAARAHAAENRIRYLKMRYLQIMQDHGLQKVRGQMYCLSVRSCSVVNVTDEKALPPEYVVEKTTLTPNKVAIRKALKEGAEIPGAELAKSYSLQVA